MNLAYLVVVVVAIASVVAYEPRPHRPAAKRRIGARGTLALGCACLLSLGCFAALLFLDERAMSQQVLLHPQPLLAWQVWDDRAPPMRWLSDVVLGIALVQSLALLVAYVLLRGATVGMVARLLVGATSLTMLVLAMTSRTLKSADLFAYAGIARLGLGAYDPRGAFAGEYAAINHYWGTPMIPDVYGPLWTFLSHAVYMSGSGLTRVILELRGLEVVAFVAIIFALRAMKYGDEVVAVFAINGAIVDQFIRDGHNDLFAIALVVLAFPLVARFPMVAVLLVAGAIAVKISFVAVGATVFAAEASRRRRLSFFAAAVLLGCGGSAAFAGAAYPNAIAEVSRRVMEDGVTHGIHVLAIVAVGLACAVALWLRRFNAGVSYAHIALGLLPIPWYVVWGFPYAMRAGFAATFLVSLPFVLSLLTMSYAFTPLRAAIFFVVVVAALFAILHAWRSGRFGPAFAARVQSRES